jgi:hypothetical protein
MENLFGFMDMAGTYEQRKVANTKINDAIIDTCAVTDSEQPYETAIQHKAYNEGQWVIVEMYDTKKQSIIGHKKWVNKFKNDLPEKLEDVSTSKIMNLNKLLFQTDYTFNKKL